MLRKILLLEWFFWSFGFMALGKLQWATADWVGELCPIRMPHFETGIPWRDLHSERTAYYSGYWDSWWVLRCSGPRLWGPSPGRQPRYALYTSGSFRRGDSSSSWWDIWITRCPRWRTLLRCASSKTMLLLHRILSTYADFFGIPFSKMNNLVDEPAHPSIQHHDCPIPSHEPEIRIPVGNKHHKKSRCNLNRYSMIISYQWQSLHHFIFHHVISDLRKPRS